MFNNQEIHQIIQHESQKLLLVLEKARCMDLPGFSEAELHLSAEAEMQRCQDALKTHNFEFFERETEAILSVRNLDFAPGSPEYGLFCRNLLKTKIQACRVEINRCNGNYDNEFDQMITPSIFKPSHPLLPTPVHSSPQGEPAKTFSLAVDSFIKSKSAKKGATLTNYDSMNRLLFKILEDKPVDQFTYDNLLAVRPILEKIPKNATSMEGMKDATIDEIINVKNPGDLISETTVMKYLTHMNTIFKFCAERDWVKHSIRPKWEMSREGKKKQKKLPFDCEDLKQLFSSKHFTSPRVRYLRPENFWCALISVLNGGRVDEICQLYKEDIVEINGTWCFDINDEGDKKTKNEDSIRKIPVHPILIELGLLDYIKSVKGKRLFSNLKRHPESGYSHDFDKNINKYIKRHVTNHDKKSFHSCRRSFSTFLKQKGVHNEVTGALLGHKAVNEITEGYTGGYPHSILLDTIKQIDLGFDLVKLVGKWDPVVARRVARKK